MSVYRAGYTECTQQIYRSIMSMDGLDHTNKYKILSKISERLHPDERLMTPPPSPKSYCPKSTYPGGHTVPCIPPPSHFDRSPARPTFIDPTNTGHLPPKSGHLPPKNVHLPADIDCMKNLNKELRSPPYPLNNERLSPPNAEFRVSYSTRYEVLHKEQLVATSKLTRHSPYAKAMDAHLEKVAASLEEGSSSVWRPWWHSRLVLLFRKYSAQSKSFSQINACCWVMLSHADARTIYYTRAHAGTHEQNTWLNISLYILYIKMLCKIICIFENGVLAFENNIFFYY